MSLKHTSHESFFAALMRDKIIVAAIAIGAVFLIGFWGISQIIPLAIDGPSPIITPPDTDSGEQLSLIEELKAQSDLKQFESYEALGEFLARQPVGSFGKGVFLGGIPEMAFETLTVEDSAGIPPGSGRSSRDFSETNIQVQGVDEADIIKTDGTYIYAASRKTLFIIQAYPGAEATILSRIVFNSTPQGLYLEGDRLVVYGASENVSSLRAPIRQSSFTFVKIFDVSNKSNPALVRDLEFEGWYSSSRMIGEYVYLVVNAPNYVWYAEEPVPLLRSDELVMPCSIDNCPVYYFDRPYQSYNAITVAAIKVNDADADITREVYLFDNNQNLFVSQSALYLTYTKHISEFRIMQEVVKEVMFPELPESDKARIAKIEAVDDFILSPQERLNKINAIINQYQNGLSEKEGMRLGDAVSKRLKEKYTEIAPELEKTVVHKINLDKEKFSYAATGEVPGYVINQYAMDEHAGYFRIATTRNQINSYYFGFEDESYSNLYVLDEDLERVGTVERLAPGERIFSVRFMQDRAYLVTFKQVDPLFVIGLDDPQNPRVLGELKISGFSNYLHPYDSETLIGFGRDADEDGRTRGLKLSLFDVKDVSRPVEIDTYVFGNRQSSSIALNDPHAFLFSRDKNLLVIPATLYDDVFFETFPGGGTVTRSIRGGPNFRGAMVFSVDKGGFELRGKVNHAEDTQTDVSEYWYGNNYYDTTVKRSLYIEDELYTLSNQFLKVNALDDLADLAKVVLIEDDFKVIPE